MATEIAQAYVQIMPSAKGIKGGIEKELGGAAGSAGKSAGHSIASGIKWAVAAAAIGKFIGKSISEGAALQQSIGGIETLFKDSADVVKQRADEAYRTAGMSANQYMELTTSFAASLLQSLGGDTAKAADISDMAMTDMSDNANKFGTDLDRITDAYRGLSMGNYRMLDNLKLGYNGTQKEMQRLLKDAQAITGVKYDINNLADVYSAIHVIQEELGITGTTAKEASETISGSFASMKAAFSNFMGKLALGEDIGPSLNALVETAATFAANLIPAILNILKALPGALVNLIRSAGPRLTQAASELIPQLVTGLTVTLPQFINQAAAMITGFIAKLREKLPEMIAAAGSMINSLVTGFQQSKANLTVAGIQIITDLLTTMMQNAPQMLAMGSSMLQNMISGMQTTFPQILSAAGQAIITLLQGIVENLPQIIQAGFDMIVSLIQGIGNAAPSILESIGSLMQQVWDAIKEIDWISLGKNIVQGLIDGIGAMGSALWEAAKAIGHSALDAIKEALGIGSPSKVMRDEAGKWIPAGIAVGIEKNTAPVRDAMRRLAGMTTDYMPRQLSMGLQPGYAMPAMGGVVMYQTINTHDSLSPAELTQEAENMFQRQKWGLP